MTVTHPVALRDGGSAPGAYTYGTVSYPIDSDGAIDCPSDLEEEIAEALAEHYDVETGELLDGEGAGGEAIDAMCSKCGQSHDDGACWDLIEQGVCPWCDDYEGDGVAQHASAAHPDAWDDYKED